MVDGNFEREFFNQSKNTLRPSAEPKTVNSVLGTDKETSVVRQTSFVAYTIFTSKDHVRIGYAGNIIVIVDVPCGSTLYAAAAVLGPWYLRRPLDDELFNV